MSAMATSGVMAATAAAIAASPVPSSSDVGTKPISCTPSSLRSISTENRGAVISLAGVTSRRSRTRVASTMVPARLTVRKRAASFGAVPISTTCRPSDPAVAQVMPSAINAELTADVDRFSMASAKTYEVTSASKKAPENAAIAMVFWDGRIGGGPWSGLRATTAHSGMKTLRRNSVQDQSQVPLKHSGSGKKQRKDQARVAVGPENYETILWVGGIEPGHLPQKMRAKGEGTAKGQHQCNGRGMF